MILYTDGSEAKRMVTVPKLTAMTIRQAAIEAANAGLNIKLTGNFESNGLITYRQSIPTGSEVQLGETITVHFVSNIGVIDREAGAAEETIENAQ